MSHISIGLLVLEAMIVGWAIWKSPPPSMLGELDRNARRTLGTRHRFSPLPKEVTDGSTTDQR